MKNTKSIAKKASIFAFALMMAVTGMGGTATGFSTISESMLTAKAESTNVTLTAEDYGLKYAFQKGEIQRGSTILSEFSFEDFQKGITFKADGTTKLILTYSDGTLVLNPLTKEVLENNRRSQISRDVVYIRKEDIRANGNGVSGYGHVHFAFFCTARNPKTGDHGVYLFGGDNLEGLDKYYNHVSNDVVTEYALIGESFFNDYEKIELPYYEDAQYYMMYAPDRGAFMMQYDILNKTATSDENWYGNRIPSTLHIDENTFPDCTNCTKVVVTSSALENVNLDYGMRNEDGTLEFDGNEFRTGGIEIRGILEFLKGDFPKIHFEFENEDGTTYYKEYLWLADGMFLNGSTEPSKLLQAKEGYDENKYSAVNGGDVKKSDTTTGNYDNVTVLTDLDGNPLYEGTNDSGKPVVRDETIGTVPQAEEYPVIVYEGAKAIANLTKSDYEKGEYVIKEYNPDKNYYVKLGLDAEGKDFIVYRWDDEIGAWVKRVDTTLKDTNDFPVNLFSFPDEFAGGIYMNGIEQMGTFTEEDFANPDKGNKITYDIRKDIDYEVIFDYGKDGGNVYTFIGVDPEFVETYGKDAGAKKTEIPYQADKGDKIIVDGTTEDGTPVHFETTANGDENDKLELPDGDYTITNDTKKIQDEVTVDRDGSENKEGSVDGNGEISGANGEKEKYVADVQNPDNSTDYVILTPDGQSVIAEGSLDSESPFDNISELPEEQAKAVTDAQPPYLAYELTTGVKNGTDDNKNPVTTETGYLFVNEDGTFTKLSSDKFLIGDVNLDSKVTVLDAVFLKQHIHNKNKGFRLQNFVNADLNHDGKVNVIDLSLLKKLLLKK